MFLDSSSEQNFSALVEALRIGDVTALIGAGVSYPLQPTWKQLHTQIQNAAQPEFYREFCPDYAPADFEYFRDLLGEQEFMALLRSCFAGPVADYPELYRLIDETEGFGHIVTTNFDEYLGTVALKNAADPEIASFPDFKPSTSRYIYLHGRAKTAESSAELVLCESGYRAAYDAFHGTHSVLVPLLTGNLVFVGYSLSDGDITALLRGVKSFRALRPEAAPGSMFIFRGIDSLNALETMAVERDRLERRWGIRPIWYLRDDGHTGLQTLIREIQLRVGSRDRGLVFIDRALSLRELGRVKDPSAEQIRYVIDLLQVPENARIFFRSASSPAWYGPLRDAGVLQIMAEPRLLADGSIQTLLWAAAPYLERIVQEHPQSAVEMAQRIRDTTNWHAMHSISRLTHHLPGEYIREVLPVLSEWLDRHRHARTYIGMDLVEAMERLIAQGEEVTALQVLEVLTTIKENATESEERDLELRVGRYELESMLPHVSTLSSIDPQGVYRIFSDRMKLLLDEMDADGGHRFWRSVLWRKSISVHEWGYSTWEESVNFVVTGARESLIKWLSVDVTQAAPEVERLILAGDELQFRLALDVLTEMPEGIRHLSIPIFTPAHFTEDLLVYELLVLLNRRFEYLSNRLQAMVHELARTELVGTQNVEMSTEDRQQIHDRRLWRLIGAIPAVHRTSYEVTEWSRLFEKFGDIEALLIPQRRSAVATFSDEDPEKIAITEELLAVYDRGPEALLTELRDVGYWGVLGRLVKQDPMTALELIENFTDQDYSNLTGYFGAYQDVLRKSDQEFAWTPLIHLMSRIADSSEEDNESTRQMMWLLSDGLIAGPRAVPDDLLHDCLLIAARVLDATCTPLGSGFRAENGIRYHQLNSVPGQAAEALMHSIWRLAEHGEGALLRGVPEHAQGYIDDALNLGWGGIELRYALGETVRLLDWCEPNWLATHSGAMLPEEDMQVGIDARYAFLHGYLISVPFTPRVMAGVRPLCQQVMSDLAEDNRQYLDERQSAERFAEHVFLGYVFDVEGYGQGQLLESLIKSAPDSTLAGVVRWASMQPVHYAEDEEKKERWKSKLNEYWRRRAQELDSLPKTQSSEELSAFVAWAKESGDPISDIEGLLMTSIEHLAPHYGVYGVFEYLKSNAASAPQVVSRLFLALVKQIAVNSNDMVIGVEDIDSTIEALCRIPGPHHSTVLKAIGVLVESGRTHLLDKLDVWGFRAN